VTVRLWCHAGPCYAGQCFRSGTGRHAHSRPQKEAIRIPLKEAYSANWKWIAEVDDAALARNGRSAHHMERWTRLTAICTCGWTVTLELDPYFEGVLWPYQAHDEAHGWSANPALWGPTCRPVPAEAIWPEYLAAEEEEERGSQPAPRPYRHRWQHLVGGLAAGVLLALGMAAVPGWTSTCYAGCTLTTNWPAVLKWPGIGSAGSALWQAMTGTQRGQVWQAYMGPAPSVVSPPRLLWEPENWSALKLPLQITNTTDKALRVVSSDFSVAYASTHGWSEWQSVGMTGPLIPAHTTKVVEVTVPDPRRVAYELRYAIGGYHGVLTEMVGHFDRRAQAVSHPKDL
jgi:hypothetical protein